MTVLSVSTSGTKNYIKERKGVTLSHCHTVTVAKSEENVERSVKPTTAIKSENYVEDMEYFKQLIAEFDEDYEDGDEDGGRDITMGGESNKICPYRQKLSPSPSKLQRHIKAKHPK